LDATRAGSMVVEGRYVVDGRGRVDSRARDGGAAEVDKRDRWLTNDPFLGARDGYAPTRAFWDWG